jgi:hypothetical protein
MATTAPARHRALRAALTLAALPLLGGFLTACGDSEESAAPKPTWTEVTRATIEPGDEVPAPTGKVVLTIKGTPVTNVGDELRLDKDLLEEMGVAKYTVFDRQAEGRDVSFSGPLLRDVLDVAGVSHTATLHAIALNDYDVDVPAGDAWEFPVLLATEADGKPMSVEHYGPTRFIYPTEGYDLDRTTYDPRWIWQLKTIEVQ